ncbi:hypothetical protein KKF05_04790 [Patescibacteria group bacterium]|nr:hypothetical protein [Patescibacteria group bacterium]MBU1029164.1 hypothetical protein [Patescibacteria group bacterium]
MTWTELIKSISRREWRIVAVVAVAAVVISSLPALFGLLLGAMRGLEWRGLLQLSPGDLAFYLSDISQAKSGRLLFENLFTVEATAPSLNLFWWLVGRLAAALALTPLAAFQLARVLLIPIFAAIVYIAISFFWSVPRQRFVAFLLMIFGSGVGLYFSPFFEHNTPSLFAYEWPIDLWVSEANAFMSLLYSPHFVAGWTLIILTTLMLLLAFSTGCSRYAVFAGLAALLLFSFHPFHAPTLYATALTFLCFMALARRFKWRDWLNVVVFILISFWSFAYHVWHLWSDDFSRQLLGLNTMITPSPLQLLIGFGVVSVLAPAGLWIIRRQTPLINQLFLSAWIVSTALLVYSPVFFQRRMLQGLEFPLVILAVPTIFAALNWLERHGRPRWFNPRLTLVALFFVVCLPSTFAVIAGSCRLFFTNQPPIFYFTPTERQALDWINQNTPVDAAFMSSVESGNSIVGWADRRVFVGHWSNSGDVVGQTKIMQRFFAGLDDQQRADFMRQQGIDYVFVGPSERRLGFLSDNAVFARVYFAENIEIFYLR